MKRKNVHIKRILFSWIVLLSALGLLLFWFSEKHIRPVMKSVLINYGQTYATDAINEAVSEILESRKYSKEDMIILNYGAYDKIDSVASDYVKMNMFKSDISLLAQEKISKPEEVPICVTMGMLSGFELLKNIGPEVTLYTTITGGVTSDFESSFKSNGINQTLFTVEAVVSANISVYASGVSADTEITTRVIVAQSLINGEVPTIVWNSDVPET